MILAEAIDGFIEHLRQQDSAGKRAPSKSAGSASQSLALLKAYFSPAAAEIQDITPARVRDFLARWYVEHENVSALPVAPETFIAALTEFFAWVDEQAGTDLSASCLPVLKELEITLPRSFEILRALSKYQAEMGGAFSFPEFLTSFEQGGQSQYDLDAPGDVGAIEAYFRILDVNGAAIRAENLITEEIIELIIFPQDIARLIAPGYIINLEIARTREGWQITG